MRPAARTRCPTWRSIAAGARPTFKYDSREPTRTARPRTGGTTASSSIGGTRCALTELTLEEYLAVPYVLTMESVERPDGEWVRRASYPELPGCVVEAWSPVEAIAELEEKRRHRIIELMESGEPIPVPRPPLRAAAP